MTAATADLDGLRTTPWLVRWLLDRSTPRPLPRRRMHRVTCWRQIMIRPAEARGLTGERHRALFGLAAIVTRRRGDAGRR